MTEATGAIKWVWSRKLAVGITLQGEGFRRRCVCGFVMHHAEAKGTKKVYADEG